MGRAAEATESAFLNGKGLCEDDDSTRSNMIAAVLVVVAIDNYCREWSNFHLGPREEGTAHLLT